jgi:hypothetical protein
MATDAVPPQGGCSRVGVIVTIATLVVLVGLIVPALQQAREAARRTHSRNNLKQIGLALHNYHDGHRKFPPGGVFNADGMAFHEWTTYIAPYLDASPWYNSINFNRPWDHPEQVDLFRDPYHHQSHFWVNPSIGNPIRGDGLFSNHYAGSQAVFYRNSAVSFKEWNSLSTRLLVADALDRFIPVGFPYGWRDVTLGFGTDSAGFGCRPRGMTHCLMGDGAVHTFGSAVDAEVLGEMDGPSDERPNSERVLKLTDYPPLNLAVIWHGHWQGTGKQREWIRRPPD